MPVSRGGFLRTPFKLGTSWNSRSPSEEAEAGRRVGLGARVGASPSPPANPSVLVLDSLSCWHWR